MLLPEKRRPPRDDSTAAWGEQKSGERSQKPEARSQEIEGVRPRGSCSFDLHGSEADPVAGLEDLIGRGRLTVHANQVVTGSAMRHALREQLGDGRAVFHMNLVGESGPVVVDVHNLHVVFSRGMREWAVGSRQ